VELLLNALQISPHVLELSLLGVQLLFDGGELPNFCGGGLQLPLVAFHGGLQLRLLIRHGLLEGRQLALQHAHRRRILSQLLRLVVQCEHQFGLGFGIRVAHSFRGALAVVPAERTR